MGTLNIVMDTRATKRGLDDLGKEQYPFALAQSLTQAATRAQGRVRRLSERKFNIKSKFTLRNIRIVPSKKSDVKLGIAVSMVFTDKRITHYMAGHEVGEIRRSRKKKLIAVPSRILKKKNFRTVSGKVKKRFLPKVLLKGKKNKTVNAKAKSGNRKAFVIDDKQNALIVRRKTKKTDSPLDLLYTLVPKTRIDKKWRFEQNVQVSVKLNFRRDFDKNMNKAIRNAK